jgi:hypothetical protein
MSCGVLSGEVRNRAFAKKRLRFSRYALADDIVGAGGFVALHYRVSARRLGKLILSLMAIATSSSPFASSAARHWSVLNPFASSRPC